MNSREFNHEHFEELCALDALGQISPDEHRELKAHLTTCSACRVRRADFTEILHEHLPLVAPEDTSLRGARNVAFHDASYKQRFMQRAQREGIVFADSVAPGKKASPGRLANLAWLVQPRRLAFSAAMLMLGFWFGTLGSRQLKAPETAAVDDPQLARLQDQNRDLKFQLDTLSRAQALAENRKAQDPLPPPQPQRDPQVDKQLAKTRQDYHSAVTRSQALDEQLQKASAELAMLREEVDKLKSEPSASAKLSETETALKQAGEELQKLQRERSVYASTFADQQTQIRELMEKLSTQTEVVNRERELMAAGRDIRELMGARNLHMIDVFDVVESRGPQRPAGRVFYTEGKSLIFYAYDLEKRRKSLEKYSFQAWAQKEAKGGGVQSLGVFVPDDQGQSRWVLKYDDPKVLAQIDSVFVTLEPKGGSERPQGQQLLYAYLRANPNHP